MLNKLLKSPAPKRKEAFTLVELLVVIAIIGILMSLLFPAVQGALGSARKTTAQRYATEIANAVVLYETEYGRLPPEGDGGTVSGDLLEALTATDTNNNPRNVQFLAADKFKQNRGGTNEANQFLDPWGGVFQIQMDTEYANSIEVGGENAVEAETIRKRVGVWNTNSNARFRVSSW